jgi:hypothetical protein
MLRIATLIVSFSTLYINFNSVIEYDLWLISLIDQVDAVVDGSSGIFM